VGWSDLVTQSTQYNQEPYDPAYKMFNTVSPFLSMISSSGTWHGVNMIRDDCYPPKTILEELREETINFIKGK
jgi:hypothetical protein